ncbi:SgcJ/EcaC family oxidoreductase [Actinoalloteichus spitiensis]|uniref:SgcJ/EcaC family oxidoreductase n=1 Tax=Actinoalloteichus spitiensis TaxID=252394 RepID=UPI000584B4A9|nr:SgcJ/EcaC family oxidoreductase [Actinoalloteichus spitiensis]
MDGTNGTATTTNDATTDHEADEAAIRHIIEESETAYNTNDAELMVAHFAENATITTATGTRVTGRQAILDHTRAALTGFLRDQYVRYEVTDVTFPGPDLALAHKSARATTADGELVDQEPSMVATYVLVRESGRWWVVARLNTLVASWG